MQPITDMHCHILPGVDDGPKTMKESIHVIAEAWRQGVRCMIATPHYHPGRYVVESNRIFEVLEDVREACSLNGIPMKLIPGQECYWYSGLIDALDNGKALTMNHTSYVLVEFEPETVYSNIMQAIRALTNSGYIPIIAHFERYRCLRERIDRLDELHELGAYLQMNFDRILDKDTFFHRNPWRRLLLRDTVDFLGSDTHGMNFRPLHVKDSVRWMDEHMREDLEWEILERNIHLLIDGEA